MIYSAIKILIRSFPLIGVQFIFKEEVFKVEKNQRNFLKELRNTPRL